MKKSYFIAAILAASSSIAAAADTTQGGNTPAPPPQKVKKICRADVGTGSIIPKRTCHSKEEWEALDRQSSAKAGKTIDEQERGLGNINGNVPTGAFAT